MSEAREELYELTTRWTIHEDIPRSQQRECRALGQRIYTESGHAGMVEACREAHTRNLAASIVAAYWDGIGNWQW